MINFVLCIDITICISIQIIYISNKTEPVLYSRHIGSDSRHSRKTIILIFCCSFWFVKKLNIFFIVYVIICRLILLILLQLFCSYILLFCSSYRYGCGCYSCRYSFVILTSIYCCDFCCYISLLFLQLWMWLLFLQLLFCYPYIYLLL